MPIAFHTDARRKYTLKADRGLPAENRPVFFLRFLTRRQKQHFLQLGQEDAASIESRSPEETIALLYARLGEVLTGWEHLIAPDGATVPFNSESLQVLDELLTEKELWELYWAGGSEVDEADLAFFASRPSSGPAESASPDKKDAPPVPESA